MTVVAAEAIPAVESGGAAGTAARTGGRTQQGRVPSASPARPGGFRPPKQNAPARQGAVPRAGGRTQQGARQQARTGGRTQQGGGNVQPTQITATGDDGQERSVTLPGASLPERGWHRWIMAEFVLAVVLVGASPFLRPGGAAGQAKGAAGEAVTLAGPVIRLTAVSLIYFILALMAQGPRSGKIAAAFGALVLLGTAFNSLPEFTTLAAAFGRGKAKPADQSGLDAGSGEGPGGAGGKK